MAQNEERVREISEGLHGDLPRPTTAINRCDLGLTPGLHVLTSSGQDSSTQRSWAGLLAPGFTYSLRLPADQPAVALVAFVSGYSGGTAADLHRFPYSPDDAVVRHPSRQFNLSTGARWVKEATLRVVGEG